ncbi:hypothetical protein, partial [Rheinheimera faecalis]|uniref:hypothetical protein n=1 Tax=Rheinheimera faecalis TaxID=2901141 RepID=UPI001E3A3EC5
MYYQYDLNGVLRGKHTGEQSTVAYQAEQPLTREQLLEKRRQLEFDEAGEFRRTEQGEQRAPDFKHYGGSSVAHYSYGGGGTYLGEFKEDGSINIRDTHFKPLDSETVAQSRSYTTQGGETLQNLAQMFLGDKDFWYLIAALNGLDSPDEALPQGKV